MTFDKDLFERMFAQAAESERKRVNFDLRNSPEDTSQRMLNAMLPETVVPVHRHALTDESVICLYGKLVEVLYEEVPDSASGSVSGDGGVACSFREMGRHVLCPAEGVCGMQVPAGVWHSVEVLEPSVIFEAKDRAYGADGSESLLGYSIGMLPSIH